MEVFDEFGKDAAFEKVDIIGSVIRTVGKEVFFGGMAMEIEVKFDAVEVFLSDLKCELMELGDLRKDECVEVFELAVEVFAGVRSSVIADDNAIDVDHGDDVKDEHFSEDLVLGFLFEELHDNALHDVGGVGLAWMNSSREEDSLFGGLDLGFGRGVVGDFEEWDVESTERLT